MNCTFRSELKYPVSLAANQTSELELVLNTYEAGEVTQRLTFLLDVNGRLVKKQVEWQASAESGAEVVRN